jgi:SH3 domain-containing YSC84-like protein 1
MNSRCLMRSGLPALMDREALTTMEELKEENMEIKGTKVRKSTLALIVAVTLLIAGVTHARAQDKAEAQSLVDKARITFQSFMSDKNYEYLRKNIKNVKALLIYPQVLKAGFILGGSGGTGVLVVRDAKAKDWSQPAFYTIGSVTFGLQIGGEAAEVIVMVMTKKAIDSLFTTSVKFGGDTSIAAGPYGAGAKVNVTADFISYAKSKGLYAGLNLEGSAVNVRESLNKAYYGKAVTPFQILVEKKVRNKGSAGLRAALKKAVK